MRLLLAIITSLLIASSSLFSQSLTVFDIDTTNFPTIKAKFYAFDASGNQIKNLSASDFEVIENGTTTRPVTNVTCPNSIPIAVSSVLVFDMSGSMSEGPPRIESAKKAANAWINGLPTGQSECALVSFDDQSMILHDFTKDRSILKNSIAQLKPDGGTDYNQALIDLPCGGLNIANSGKNKRVLIFLTDGQPNFEPRTQDIINFAKQYQITIYAVTLDMPAPQCIKDITMQTGGQYFENITTQQEAEETYQKLLQLATNVEPCEITWQSGISCTAGITNATIKLIPQNLTKNVRYTIPRTSVAKLEFNPTYIKFENPQIGKAVSQDITVIARNSTFTVTDIKVSNQLFDISPKSFTLQANESKILTISYIAKDSGNTFTKFSFEAVNQCNKDFYASARWTGKKPDVPTLKVIHPNGGECLAVGSDTVITWEGIPADEFVKLEYSIDNGTSWKYIDTARGLSYKWNKVPEPTSNQCLMKVYPIEEANSISWSKTYGGSSSDEANSIIEDSDGNYVVAGWTNSTNGDVHGNEGEWDYWILKINPITGDTIWTKTYGGSSSDEANSIIEDSDGNYVVAGWTNSTNGDVYENKGGSDYWILKINPLTGDTIWTRTYGGSNNDYAYSIIEDSDGNYVVAGETASIGYDIHGNKGKQDFWILKINPLTGDTIWTKTYGGSEIDFVNSIIEDSDGNYVMAGSSSSTNGDVHINKGGGDYCILKINSLNGDTIWTKTYGGNYDDQAYSIIEDSDGYYLVAGSTYSDNNGDVHGNKGGGDYWLLKLNPQTGDTIWTKTYGGSNYDYAFSIIEDSDENYVVAGSTYSEDGDVHGNKGGGDYWLLKLNPQTGDTIWTKTYGGSTNDYAYSIIEDSDGNYVLAGDSQSDNGDVPSNKGNSDSWILKFSEPKELQSDISDSLFSIVAPEVQATAIDMKECLVNSIKDSLFTGFIQNIGTYKCRIDSIYFTGADKDAFSLVSGLPVYTVAAGANKATEFRFKPTEERVYNAEIVILTQSDTLKVTISGIGVAQKIEVLNNLIDFGVVKCGESKQYIDTATIRNVGKDFVTITKITNAGPNNTDFEILNLAPSYTLQVGDSLKLSLKFTANSIGRTSGRLLFDYEGQLQPAEVQLYAQAVGGLVRIDDDSAFAGEKKKIRLRLMNNLYPIPSATVLPFRARIKYNPTLLTMTDSRGKKSVDKEYEIYDVKGNWDMAKGNLLGEFDYVAGLGNSTYSYFLLDEFQWLDNSGQDIKAEVERIDGLFTSLGICHEGGTRLVNPNANIGIQSITPNPAKDKITITAKITEIGTKIKLIDIAGMVIKEIDCAVDKTKVQDFTIDFTNIPAGMYFIEFKSVNFSQVEKIVVEK